MGSRTPFFTIFIASAGETTGGDRRLNNGNGNGNGNGNDNGNGNGNSDSDSDSDSDDAQSGSINGAKSAPTTGTCMGDDSVGIVQGVGSVDSLNCVANDVSITSVKLISGPSSCVPGETVTVTLAVDLQSTSNKRRSDIGVWVANDVASDAQTTGSCTHFWFETGSDTSLGELPDFEGTDAQADGCGDIGAQLLYSDVLLIEKGDESELTVECVNELNTGDNLVDIDYCVAWKVPGQETVCPYAGATDDWTYRAGTVPGTTAKCRCERIDIPMTIAGPTDAPTSPPTSAPTDEDGTDDEECPDF